MKQIAPLLLIACLAAPAQAQSSDVDEGVNLLNEGARLLFRGLLDEVEPAMRDLAQQLQQLNWNGITIQDLDDYEAPEVLPNGDIILRRKPTVLAPPSEGEIDL